jgi:hypothetical protein
MERAMQSNNRGREWFTDLLDPPEPTTPSPPQLTRPVLIWEDGDFAYISDEFSVRVSDTDPNAVKGIGRRIVICKVKGTER